MKQSRRNFIRTLAAAGLIPAAAKAKLIEAPVKKSNKPIVVSTWQGGMRCNETAFQSLKENNDILTAIEDGIHVLENDPNEMSVGYGGYPDADGEVTLDASIMDWQGNAGGVCYLKNIKNPISVARLVMEKTPHVLLAGEGAKKFALGFGFKEENLLTEHAKKEWEKNKQAGKDFINHDTIGLLMLDSSGKISGGVSTSGWAYKVPGRVGDSPIIGAGLFVDGEVGAACATGTGELAMKTLGSFLVVEKMKEGYSPEEACKFVCKRIFDKYVKEKKGFEIAFLALSVSGEYGAFSISDGFSFSVLSDEEKKIHDSKFFYSRK